MDYISSPKSDMSYHFGMKLFRIKGDCFTSRIDIPNSDELNDLSFAAVDQYDTASIQFLS